MNIRELPYNLYKNGTIEDRKLKTLLTSTGTLSQAIRLTPIQSSNSCEELPYTLYINGIKKNIYWISAKWSVWGPFNPQTLYKYIIKTST